MRGCGPFPFVTCDDGGTTQIRQKKALVETEVPARVLDMLLRNRMESLTCFGMSKYRILFDLRNKIPETWGHSITHHQQRRCVSTDGTWTYV